ncbi:MAG: addiction module protein [Planctomycetota bacterium]
MSTDQYEELVNRAVALPEAQRTDLIDRLVDSLPAGPSAELPPGFREKFEQMRPELERRFQNWKENGQGVPAEKVFERMRAKYDGT